MSQNFETDCLVIITASYTADRSLSLCTAWSLNRVNFLLWGNARESGRAAKCVGTEDGQLSHGTV
jgi:hypothetical protein